MSVVNLKYAFNERWSDEKHSFGRPVYGVTMAEVTVSKAAVASKFMESNQM